MTDFTRMFAHLTSSPASCSPRSSTSSQHASSADATCCSALLPPSLGCSAAAASHLSFVRSAHQQVFTERSEAE